MKILLKDERMNSIADNDWAIELASEISHVEVLKILKEYISKKK